MALTSNPLQLASIAMETSSWCAKTNLARKLFGLEPHCIVRMYKGLSKICCGIIVDYKIRKKCLANYFINVGYNISKATPWLH